MAWIQSRTTGLAHRSVVGIGVAALLQLLIAVYIGFFGAGAGILVLALFALMGVGNIHSMNAYKTMLVGISNGVAVITFIVARAVLWPQAVVMLCGAILGGYAGAYYALKIKPARVRLIVILVGMAMSIYFFVKYGL